MNVTLLKALISLLPAPMLFFWFGSFVLENKGSVSFLQLLGTGGLVVVVLTHVSEALSLLPEMNWGLEDSVGHYIDFGSVFLVSRYSP